MASWPAKDPEEVLDYDIDWTLRLDGDTIESSNWTIDSGSVVKNSDTFSTTSTKIWLSGGTLGESCLLTNLITTTGARTMDQSVKLKIKAK